MSRELVSAVAEGPKASDQFACAAAGLVAAVAAMRGDPGLLSAFLGQVAARLIKVSRCRLHACLTAQLCHHVLTPPSVPLLQAIGAGDEDCCGNLGLLVAYLCLVGAIGGDVVLGLLLHLVSMRSPVCDQPRGPSLATHLRCPVPLACLPPFPPVP